MTAGGPSTSGPPARGHSSPGRHRAPQVVALVCAILLAGACTPTTAKSGGASVPTVLTLQLAEGREVAYAPAVEHFARTAHEASDGSLVIDVVWEHPQFDPQGEAALVTQVRSGQAQLSHVPARTFDRAGVDRFVALQDPFTLDSLAAADAVAQGPLAEQLLADLREDGLVGLAMYAENLRRPVGYRGALLTASDFVGLTVRAQPSTLTYDLLGQLGASPAMSRSYVMDADGVAYDAAESAWMSWAGQHPFPRGATITANVVLFPKFNVFVAHPATYDALETPQQEALRQAAGETARWWETSYRPTEEQLAEEWCTGGRRAAMASQEDLDTLEEALRPLVARLEADLQTRSTLQQVRQVAATAGADDFTLPPWCLPPTGDGARLEG